MDISILDKRFDEHIKNNENSLRLIYTFATNNSFDPELTLKLLDACGSFYRGRVAKTFEKETTLLFENLLNGVSTS